MIKLQNILNEIQVSNGKMIPFGELRNRLITYITKHINEKDFEMEKEVNEAEDFDELAEIIYRHISGAEENDFQLSESSCYKILLTLVVQI